MERLYSDDQEAMFLEAQVLNLASNPLDAPDPHVLDVIVANG